MHYMANDACRSLEQMIQARRLKIQEMVSHASLRVEYVTEADLLTIDPSGRSFHNVNTPADLEAARSLLARVPPQDNLMSTVRRTIIMIHPGGLGDVLLAVPAMVRLRTRFPNHQLVLCAEDQIARLLLACRIIDAWTSVQGRGCADLFAGCGLGHGSGTGMAGGLRACHWLDAGSRWQIKRDTQGSSVSERLS